MLQVEHQCVLMSAARSMPTAMRGHLVEFEVRELTTARAETEATLMKVPNMVWGRVKR